MTQLRFDKKYFSWASGLLVIEVFIALFLHDKIIRPYAGDVLAPVFLYCLVRSAVTISTRSAAVLVLLVSYLIELLQYFHLLTLLGWQRHRLVAVVLGNHFEWVDLLAYTAGVALILLAEHRRRFVAPPGTNGAARPVRP